jgi:MoxR-like ATPase
MSQENQQELNQNAKGPEGLRATSQLIAHSRAELGRVISGQGEVIEEVLIAVLCQGHALLEGVPGIAKTLIVKALGRLLGLGFQRVQATPDLMPADILGTTILRPGRRLQLPRRTGLHRPAAGRRDQPHASPHPGRAARVHGRAPGDHGRNAPPAARLVYRLRHAESDRLRGHLPAARGAVGPLSAQDSRGLPHEQEERQILERHHAARAPGCWKTRQLRPFPRGCWPRPAPRCAPSALSRSCTTTF